MGGGVYQQWIIGYTGSSPKERQAPKKMYAKVTPPEPQHGPSVNGSIVPSPSQ